MFQSKSAAVKISMDFDEARIANLVLAKVGNPARNESLQTSKQLFKVAAEDQSLLTSIFVKPFRSLLGQRFHHHTSLEKHQINGCSQSIFADPSSLLERGREIAERLFAKSNHPNIKSGDLCIALINGIGLDGERKQAICVLKSESVTPFLSISARDGDLELATEQGINPEKIDKGCLIVDHMSGKGYYVLSFDRGSVESRFWVRDFLGVVPISDPSVMSKKVAELAVLAVAPVQETDEVKDEDSPPWEVNKAAAGALSYFDGKKKFSLQEFEEQALRTPAAKARFAAGRDKMKLDEGVEFSDDFEISAREVAKAKKLMKSTIKLDTGVELRLKQTVVDSPETVLEKGYDQDKKMRFIKVYFNRELN